MSDKKWVFDEDALITADETGWTALKRYVQSECESHAKKEVKKFADGIKNIIDTTTSRYLYETINDFLKNRGI